MTLRVALSPLPRETCIDGGEPGVGMGTASLDPQANERNQPDDVEQQEANHHRQVDIHGLGARSHPADKNHTEQGTAHHEAEIPERSEESEEEEKRVDD